MGKITKIDRIIPTIKKRIKVAAYARVSMETERLNHSLSQQVSFYNNFMGMIIQEDKVNKMKQELKN